MRLSRHTRSFKRVLYAPITIIILVALSVVLARAAIASYLNNRQNKAEFETLEARTEELREREYFLTNEIERLQSERGVEEELRNNFPVVREGESMVIIVEPAEQKSASHSSNSRGFWEKIKGFFWR